MLRILTIIFCFMCFQIPLSATDITVKEYHKDLHGRDQYMVGTIKMYVMGIGQGISWANSVAEKKGAPLYCPAPKLAMNGSNYLGILDEMIDTVASKKTAKELDELPVAMLLLMGLEETFPCPAK